VDVRSTELIGGHDLTGCGLDQRRSAQENRAVACDDHRFVGHRGDVRAAGRARSHHGRDLRDPLARHARLVVEDASEVIAVRENLSLQR
jgi:hypothetical protein